MRLGIEDVVDQKLEVKGIEMPPLTTRNPEVL